MTRIPKTKVVGILRLRVPSTKHLITPKYRDMKTQFPVAWPPPILAERAEGIAEKGLSASYLLDDKLAVSETRKR